MAKFNTDVVFIDASGQVRTIHGDLTLRANPNGDGHIIVGSGVSLRPEVNCDASDAIDLGQENLRWKTLFACSGNFLERPTVNGSGVLLQGDTVAASVAAGVDTLNGVSGVINLVSVNDAITITTNGQAIEFSGIFIQASGTLLDTVSDLVASGVVNRLNGLSGIVDITTLDGLNLELLGQVIQLEPSFNSVSGVLLNTVSDLVASGVVNRLNGLSGLVDLLAADGSMIITPSGNDIFFQVDPLFIENAINLSGISDSQVYKAIGLQSTTSTTLVTALSGIFSIETSGHYRLFYSMQAGCDQSNKLCEFTVEFEDFAGNSLALMDVVTSFNVGGGELPFAGIQHGNLDPDFVSIIVKYRFADTGTAEATLRRISLEVNRLGAPSGVGN